VSSCSATAAMAVSLALVSAMVFMGASPLSQVGW
jgi:hypothetical protein